MQARRGTAGHGTVRSGAASQSRQRGDWWSGHGTTRPDAAGHGMAWLGEVMQAGHGTLMHAGV